MRPHPAPTGCHGRRDATVQAPLLKDGRCRWTLALSSLTEEIRQGALLALGEAELRARIPEAAHHPQLPGLGGL